MKLHFMKWFMGLHLFWWRRCMYNYFYINILSKDARFWGYDSVWYDGPHPMFGFWFFNVGADYQ